jgi:hypothetical protein
MKKLIGRTLFWFSNGEEQLSELNTKYFALGNLLNRLLNEKYDGKKIIFINIYYRTEKSYLLFQNILKNDVHFYGGYLKYDDVFDVEAFGKMNKNLQDITIWNRACEILVESSKVIKNLKLLEAVEYAHKKGLEIDLNPNYQVIESEVIIYGQLLKASVWINFNEDGMYSKFTLEKNSKIVFERLIDNTVRGVEFFLVMYKKIEVKDDDIIIKGSKDVDYLPLTIPIDRQLIL